MLPPPPPPVRTAVTPPPVAATTYRPAIIAHDVAQMTLALRVAASARRPVCIVSPPGGGAVLGAEVFLAMAAAAARAVPLADATFMLDCDDAPGFALAAIRHGVRQLRVRLAPPVLDRLRSAASQTGCSVNNEEMAALDLADCADEAAAAHKWLLTS
jgi:hypothetical protein